VADSAEASILVRFLAAERMSGRRSAWSSRRLCHTIRALHLIKAKHASLASPSLSRPPFVPG